MPNKSKKIKYIYTFIEYTRFVAQIKAKIFFGIFHKLNSIDLFKYNVFGV